MDFQLGDIIHKAGIPDLIVHNEGVLCSVWQVAVSWVPEIRMWVTKNDSSGSHCTLIVTVHRSRK
jgi:hypothetical protein